MSENSASKVFYNFRNHMIEVFNYIVKRQSLQNILLESGAMKFYPELEDISNDPVYFEKEIVGSSEEYSDLCLVSPYVETRSLKPSYIRVKDLYSLLISKGFSEESAIKAISNDGIYLKRDDIVNIGAGNLKNSPYAHK